MRSRRDDSNLLYSHTAGASDFKLSTFALQQKPRLAGRPLTSAIKARILAHSTSMALDLSSKPTTGPLDSYSVKPPSPTLSSDLDTSLDRPSSAFSDVAERPGDSSFQSSFSGLKGAVVKPMPGPIPSPITSRSPSADHNEEKLSPGNTRPFKVYPFEPVPNMYSQVAASAASLSAAGLYNPFAGAAAPGAPMPGFPGLLDPTLSLSTPITQYIQQKRRRAEGRNSHGRGGDDSALKSPSSNTSDISSTSRDNGHLSETSEGAGPSSPGSSIAEHHLSHNQQQHSFHEGPEPKRARTSTGDCPLPPPSDGSSVEERREFSYWDRRRKNNEAAKRSRDARRAKEEEIALRAAFLEQENLKLRAQVSILKTETAKLHYMLYNRL